MRIIRIACKNPKLDRRLDRAAYAAAPTPTGPRSRIAFHQIALLQSRSFIHLLEGGTDLCHCPRSRLHRVL